MDPQRLVATWLDGRLHQGRRHPHLGPRRSAGLAEKLRRAYSWITEQALVVPYFDLELGAPVYAWVCSADTPRHAPKQPAAARSPDAKIALHRVTYDSCVLLPLLSLVTAQRLLFVGAPGRGKTTMATLMAALAGIPLARSA